MSSAEIFLVVAGYVVGAFVCLTVLYFVIRLAVVHALREHYAAAAAARRRSSSSTAV